MLCKFSFFPVLFMIIATLASLADANFTDVTDLAGVGDENWGVGITVGDYDNDGDPDIYVSNGFYTDGEENVLYRNNGDGTFSDVTIEAGVEAFAQGSSTIFFDYDNDGLLDIYATCFDQTDFLFHNLGNGRFANVTEEAGIKKVESIGVNAFDYDNDGLLDILVGNGVLTEGRRNNFYHNNGDGKFTDIVESANLEFSSGTNFPAVCDYDNDGDMDVYLTNYIGPGILYQNNGDGTFKDVMEEAGIVSEDRSWTATWADYDNDGDFDLFVAGFFVPGWPESHCKLYRNNGDGTFGDVTVEVGLGQIGNGYIYSSFADYGNDGYLDLYVTRNGGVQGPLPNFMFRNNGDGKFIDVTEEAGLLKNDVASSNVLFDYDGDGDLDIYLTQWLGEPNRLYRNNGNENHWLHIKAIGTKSNRNGIGAKVKVVAGELSMLRMVGVGSGNGSNVFAVEFGLGSNVVADLVEVRWQSGQVDVFENVPADQFITITEGELTYKLGGQQVVTSGDKCCTTWGKVKIARLLQNYPNPFNPETWIPYQLDEEADVTIEIFNSTGQLVRTLHLGYKSAGIYADRERASYWDGKNEVGEYVANGTYFYSIKADEFREIRKMTVIR